MLSFGDEIVNKMKESVYSGLSWDFIYSLTNESERGAVLIGASKVEEYLKKITQSILPKHSNKYKDKLFKYPGPLSSFSGNIELLFAFRIIDEDFYKAINALRKVRNDAAHSSKQFTLIDKVDNLKTISSFEEHFEEIVETLAKENIITWKQNNIKKALAKLDINAKESEKEYKKRASNLENHPSVINQLPIWKLSYSLTFICIKALLIQEKVSNVLEKDKTWLDFAIKKSV